MVHTHRLWGEFPPTQWGIGELDCQIVKCIRAIWKIFWTIYAHFSTSPCFCRVCLREVPTIHSTLVSNKWLQGSLQNEGKHTSTWGATKYNIYMKSKRMLYYMPIHSLVFFFPNSDVLTKSSEVMIIRQLQLVLPVRYNHGWCSTQTVILQLLWLWRK